LLNKIRSNLHQGDIAHEPDASILEVSGLNARYNGALALDEISFSLHQGERVAVVGPNGAGKSTLFLVIAGIKQADEGQVSIFGHRPGKHICIAYVPQRSQVDLSFPATVEDVVMMGRVGKIGLLRWPRRSDWDLVHRSLELVDMDGRAGDAIGDLSGGQLQRVFIAQALSQEADLILMDEPFTGLDAPSRQKIFSILDLLRERGITVMVATHDLKLASTAYDRVMLLNRRLLAFGPPEEALAPQRLLAAYGDHMHVFHDEDGEMLMIEDKCHDC